MAVEKIQSFAEGRWQAGEGAPRTLVNPSNGQSVAEFAPEGLDVAAAFNHARTVGGPALRQMSFVARGELLSRIGAALSNAREELIASSVLNGGCTRGDAKFDVDGGIFVVNHYAQLSRDLGDRTFFADGDGISFSHSPRFWGQHVWTPRHGIALLINAFNFPTWGFAEKLACAVLAGVPVVNKPATATALTAYQASRAIIENADLPDGVFSLLLQNPGSFFPHLQSQDIVAFTGSANTANSIRTNPHVLEHGVRVSVEADSLNAAILGPDVDLSEDTGQLFFKEISKEMTQKAGQKCTAIRRILVPTDKVDAVISTLGERLSEIKMGDPSREDVRLGPLVSMRELESAKKNVESLLGETEIAYGSMDAPETLGMEKGQGAFFSPMILKAKDSSKLDKVNSTEVFASCVTVIPYDGKPQTAVNIVASGRGALLGSVYSDDKAFLETAVLELAPFHGRLYLGSKKVADQAPGSGLVFPQCVHGGPGRAGGGEELGGVRGIKHYMQRTAIQGARAWVERLTQTKST